MDADRVAIRLQEFVQWFERVACLPLEVAGCDREKVREIFTLFLCRLQSLKPPGGRLPVPALYPYVCVNGRRGNVAGVVADIPIVRDAGMPLNMLIRPVHSF